MREERYTAERIRRLVLRRSLAERVCLCVEGNHVPLAGNSPGARVRQRRRLVGNNGLEIGALPPLLAAVAVGGGGSDAGHLFSLVNHSLLEVSSIHHPEAAGPL